MKRIHKCLAIAIFQLLYIPPLLAADTSSQDEQEIRALAKELISACEKKDVAKIMSFYVPNETFVVFDLTPPPQFVGHKTEWKNYEDFYSAFPGEVDIDVAQFAVTVDGTMAFSHEFDTWRVTDKDGKQLSFTGRETYVYQKIQGKWLIVHEHCSVPVDIVTGRALLQFNP